MQIIHWGRARQFFKRHKRAEEPLKQWRTAVQGAEWKNFADVRKTFRSADWVAGRIVFDIMGNHYRLICIACFENGRIYINNVLTHKEYDEGGWLD